jgi:hypothetical protein
MKKNLAFVLSVLSLLPAATTFAAECFELGPQAETSVLINAKTLRGKFTAGEEKTRIRATREEVGGSLATYSFMKDGEPWSLTILNEVVDEEDSRYRGILTQTDSLERIFMGCEI